MARRPLVLPVSVLAVLLLGRAAAAQSPGVAYLPPAQVKADFLKLLERPHGELKPEFRSEQKDDLTIEVGTFYSEPTEQVPTLIMRQTGRTGRLPVVIYLHGTAGSKSDFDAIMPRLARRGYLAVSIDARYHGDRVSGGAEGAKQYNEAIIGAWRAKPGEKQEHPYWYDTSYDLWRTVDYLVTRPDVDADRIGALGISMGGTEILFAASVDDRIKVSVPLIAVQSLRWSLENDQWQARVSTILSAHAVAAYDMGKQVIDPQVVRALWNKVVPGSLDEFDVPSMIRLFAPRPLMILNGELDENCPLPGAQVAFEQAKAAYLAANADEQLEIFVAQGVGHQVMPAELQLADEWFDKWLKP